MSSKFVLTQDLLEPARVRLLEQETQIILKMSLSKIISKSFMETEQKLPVKICLVDKKVVAHAVVISCYNTCLEQSIARKIILLVRIAISLMPPLDQSIFLCLHLQLWSMVVDVGFS
ncbi:unnamed protein product [Rhizophagus irregularis]|uniref:Uncharacterized protein n=1 Tax=Rhizophagus irregularis TaxID=588596 RepID=A0A2I1DVB9_9GLOM|nr:hypothetical protein RhiirB3_425705 [Rhizophagus irregularis]CAB4489622.1 unnamed protein product [Rhizophagus irregularis]CAB5186500.1 unnamed protein product [Rhizophagus irregularis]CAB5368804.1 unnamed protein product [Rhizophagus irregularis]